MQGSVSLFLISKGPSNLLINQFIFYIYFFFPLALPLGALLSNINSFRHVCGQKRSKIMLAARALWSAWRSMLKICIVFAVWWYEFEMHLHNAIPDNLTLPTIVCPLTMWWMFISVWHHIFLLTDQEQLISLVLSIVSFAIYTTWCVYYIYCVHQTWP